MNWIMIIAVLYALVAIWFFNSCLDLFCADEYDSIDGFIFALFALVWPVFLKWPWRKRRYKDGKRY